MYTGVSNPTIVYSNRCLYAAWTTRIRRLRTVMRHKSSDVITSAYEDYETLYIKSAIHLLFFKMQISIKPKKETKLKCIETI